MYQKNIQVACRKCLFAHAPGKKIISSNPSISLKYLYLALQLARQTSRYKVVSKHRNDVEDDDEDTDEVDAAMQEMMKLYQLYDVVLDEAQSR
jgi:hypothetical protein